MDSYDEGYRWDDYLNHINDEGLNKKSIEDDLYDVRENKDETFKYNPMTDSGDLMNNNDERIASHPRTETLITTNEYPYFHRRVHEFHKVEDEENIIRPEKIDLKDFNPYEPSSSPVLNHSKLDETESAYEHSSSFDIEYSTTSTSLILPQIPQHDIISSESFQQLWSPRVYSPKLIDLKASESTYSNLWSFGILLSKLIISGLHILYSCTKILQYDFILFSFSYLFGALFGRNAYFLIDILLIFTCIISILVATYENWLFRSVHFNVYDHQLNNTENEHRYWRQIKLIAYGFAIGTISSFLV